MSDVDDWRQMKADLRAATEAQITVAGELSALVNRTNLGLPGASATVTQQSNSSILMAGAILAIAGVGLLTYSLGARSGDAAVLEIRERQVSELKTRVDMLEAYQQQFAKRLNQLEAKE